MHPRAVLRCALALTTASLGAACYLVTPYEDLTSGYGTRDGAATDGSVAAETGPSADAAPSWCQQNQPGATFCDDFDQGISSLWQSDVTTPDSLASDTTTFDSGTLRVSIPADTTTNNFVYLDREIVPPDGGDYSFMRVGFDVYLDDVSVSDANFVMEVAFGQASADLWATAGHSPGNSNVEETVTLFDGTVKMNADHDPWTPTSGSAATWDHLELAFTVTPSGDGGTYTFAVDEGAPATIPLLAGWSPGGTRIRAGFVQVNLPPVPRTIHLDNIYVYAH